MNPIYIDLLNGIINIVNTDEKYQGLSLTERIQTVKRMHKLLVNIIEKIETQDKEMALRMIDYYSSKQYHNLKEN